MQAQQSQVSTVSLETIEAELKAFEEKERERLGLDKPKQWREERVSDFTRSQRDSTTILFGGLTVMQDKLISSALGAMGYTTQALDCADNDALQLGKEYGNRAQCNPTYYTVGNLIKYLNHLREEKGLSHQQIVDNYILLTAGACGPCRFGMYVTEYRKALRDAGYEGFRVHLFQQSLGAIDSTEESGLDYSFEFFRSVVRAVMAGDVLNLMGYRIRPYEVEANATDKALDRCRDIVAEAFTRKKSVIKAMRRCRDILNEVKVDRLQPKPKVSVIGEFYAMTTEGDANYRLQRFLESEGAEVDIQPVTNWLLYMLWEHRSDALKMMKLKRTPDELAQLQPGHSEKSGHSILGPIVNRIAEAAIRYAFNRYAKAIGLEGYHLGDPAELARLSSDYYLDEVRGGEGHMEVGKLIYTVQKKKAHLVVSVKPFGCMPSSAVSDGVQTLVTARYPQANFLAIETSGDGAVNVYSRVQMALFKVREKARREFDEALAEGGLALEEARVRLNGKRAATVHYPAHREACTAANGIYELL